MYDAAVATRSFRNAVHLLLGIGGTRSFALSNPLQRAWRDLEVAGRHGLNNTLMNREEYALSMLGTDQAFPDFLRNPDDPRSPGRSPPPPPAVTSHRGLDVPGRDPMMAG
ncbi:hypothetical protein [Streptomyces sp. NPDC017435]|uniref:hypothetical protein n=1 Tax=Streptomyces sp. NPDC017435 TaxID=3364995 RepID=UPI0037BDF6CD